jgi:hypothetical protein
MNCKWNIMAIVLILDILFCVFALPHIVDIAL